MDNLDFFISKLIITPNFPNKVSFTMKELVSEFVKLGLQNQDEIEELVYDNISSFTKPTYILGYYVIWEKWLSTIIFYKLSSYDEIMIDKRHHEQIIDQRIREQITLLNPRAFEYFTGRLISESTIYTDVKISPATRDGGIDISGYMEEDGTKIRVLFELKTHSKPIGPSVVDRLVGVMDFEKQKLERLGEIMPIKGVIVSVSGFTDGALKRTDPNNMEYWDIQTLIRLSKETQVGMKKIEIPIIDDEWDNY